MSDSKAPSDLDAVRHLQEAVGRIKTELGKVIVGQEEVIDQLMMSILGRGHCLLMGVPGLAKTLMISTLARTLNLSFNRIQFTPDLMPSDITGTEIIEEDRSSGNAAFKFIAGPIFANVILADEINRTPPKTQAALLEAMQEHQVSAAGTAMPLAAPFFVLATQNPIEQEGTYPLPEAQLDRFMFMVHVHYPSADEELRIIQQTTSDYVGDVRQVLSGAEIESLQELVRRVPVSDHVVRYAMEFARRTRVQTEEAADFCKEWLAWGAGPRASQYLILAGKARAVLAGRHFVSGEDIRAVAKPVLRHRIIVNFSAEAEGISSDTVIEKLIESVPRNESEITSDGRLSKVLGSEDPQ
ncbi:MAG: AAA family ATPase [Planctomycetes bacterium]|nr:AAA family ATPase [Planctomycetota bacterium]